MQTEGLMHGGCCIEWSGLRPWPAWTLCCIGQDTLPSQCFSPSQAGVNVVINKFAWVTLQWNSIHPMERGVKEGREGGNTQGPDADYY